MRKTDAAFSQSASEVARTAQCDVATVRGYVRDGLIEAFRLGNGMLLFRASAAAEVARLVAARSRWRQSKSRTAA